MKILVWQWSRIGSGPRFAAMLVDAIRALPDTEAQLSLSDRADILSGEAPPRCDLVIPTYGGKASFAGRVATAPILVAKLVSRLRALAPDCAVCAHPGPLDPVMGVALRLAGVPFAVIVHDADRHPGDGFPGQMPLQRLLCRMADGVAAMTRHVADRLTEQRATGRNGGKLIRLTMPPLRFGPPIARPAGGPLRLLFFGRLLAYKGLDLLLETLEILGPGADLVVRIAGQGTDTPVLSRLRAHPGVSVDNRYVPEQELPDLLGWCDALILPYREASQSGVAAAGLAAGRAIIATDVGGLAEQIGGRPGVVLCQPDAKSLAACVRAAMADRAALTVEAVDAAAAWRAFAASLLSQFQALHPR